jgi:iron-sulfur cluster assembly accessory protein
MPAETFDLSVTDAARARLAALMATEDRSRFLRVAVRPGGCSGFSYEMYFDDAAVDSDVRVDLDGMAVVVDATSAPLLDGATVDFLDTLTGGGFRIDNPSASRTCGCGQSFS